MKDTPLIVECLNVGPFEVNTYVLACPETLEGVIVDPGGEDETLVQFIDENKIHPRYIINTHGHPDHVFSNVSLSRYYHIPVCMHPEDKLFFQTRTASRDLEMKDAYDVDISLCHGHVLSMGTRKIKVIHTPGHTPGSICLYTDNCLFSGDTLFVGSAGRTDLPGGNLDALIRSIQKEIISLPPATRLYPGHDYGETPFSTIGQEIQENIYITDFISSPG